MTFSQPSAGGDTFVPAEHLGTLLLILPKAYDPSVITKASKEPTAQADCDIIIVDKLGPDGRPLFFSDARLFGNLARNVRKDVGGQVLGRLGQGQPSPGRSAPWTLAHFTDQEAASAQSLLAQYQQGLFKATENPMAATAPGATQYAAAPAAPAAQWQPPVAAQPTYQPPVAAQPTYQPPAQQATGAAPAQWQPPAPTPTAPATPPTSAAIDPNLVAWLQQRGVTLPPNADQAMAEAIASSFAT